MTTPTARESASALLARLAGTLVVSCQAPPGHPFANSSHIAALCRCAELGGAAGVRVDGAEGVTAARATVQLPIVGLMKAWAEGRRLTNGRPAITATVADAIALREAGADIVAVEATRELHGDELSRHLKAVREAIDVAVMADVSTLEEGLLARDAGVDLVASTLSGYTRESLAGEGPDLALVAALAELGITTVAEGRIGSPAEARAALVAGAHFVVVGGAITDPLARTALFARAVASARESA